MYEGVKAATRVCVGIKTSSLGMGVLFVSRFGVGVS